LGGPSLTQRRQQDGQCEQQVLRQRQSPDSLLAACRQCRDRPAVTSRGGTASDTGLALGGGAPAGLCRGETSGFWRREQLQWAVRQLRRRRPVSTGAAAVASGQILEEANFKQPLSACFCE